MSLQHLKNILTSSCEKITNQPVTMSLSFFPHLPTVSLTVHHQNLCRKITKQPITASLTSFPHPPCHQPANLPPSLKHYLFVQTAVAPYKTSFFLHEQEMVSAANCNVHISQGSLLLSPVVPSRH